MYMIIGAKGVSHRLTLRLGIIQCSSTPMPLRLVCRAVSDSVSAIAHMTLNGVDSSDSSTDVQMDI